MCLLCCLCDVGQVFFNLKVIHGVATRGGYDSIYKQVVALSSLCIKSGESVCSDSI